MRRRRSKRKQTTPTPPPLQAAVLLGLAAKEPFPDYEFDVVIAYMKRSTVEALKRAGTVPAEVSSRNNAPSLKIVGQKGHLSARFSQALVLALNEVAPALLSASDRRAFLRGVAAGLMYAYGLCGMGGMLALQRSKLHSSFSRRAAKANEKKRKSQSRRQKLIRKEWPGLIRQYPLQKYKLSYVIEQFLSILAKKTGETTSHRTIINDLKTLGFQNKNRKYA